MTTPSRESPKFLLAGNGPYANRGCEAIVRGTVELLCSRYPDAKFILSSFGRTRHEEALRETDPRITHKPHVDPPEPVRRFSAEWLRRLVKNRDKNIVDTRPFGAQVDALSECECALLLGGDNYTLDYGRPVAFVEMNNALLATGKPVVLWGASVGPFTSDPEFEAEMRDHLRSLTVVLARESATVEYLASIDVEENVRVVADPAFVMKPSEPALPDNLLEFIRNKPIALNFSPLAGKYRSGGEHGWLDLVVECILRVIELNIAPVLLVPHVTIDTSYDNDFAFLEKVGQRLPGWNEQVKILPPVLSAAETKWVISHARAFAGARMHATVAAVSSLVPTLFIGYSLKYKGINSDLFGHERWLISVDSLEPSSFAQRFLELLNSEAEVKETLKAALPDVCDKARAAVDHISEVISRC